MLIKQTLEHTEAITGVEMPRTITVPSIATAMVLALVWHASAAGHLAPDQVRARLEAAGKGKASFAGADMTGDDLTGLDLSGANLAGAKLAGANLHGVKLVGADLAGADLSKADLTETWIMKANFDHANLHGATLQVVITSEGMDNKRETAASFVGADLSDTSATVHFSYDDMHDAYFRGTQMSVVLANQSMGMLRSEFVGANLENADFTGAKLGRITFEFAKLKNASFRGADLTRADFAGAYLIGTDFTGAKLDNANFEQATIQGAKGLPSTIK